MFIQFGSDMGAPLFPEVLQSQRPSAQEALPLATEGVQRFVWESRFGAMLIEVVNGVAYVNGTRVEPSIPSPPQGEDR